MLDGENDSKGFGAKIRICITSNLYARLSLYIISIALNYCLLDTLYIQYIRIKMQLVMMFV